MDGYPAETILWAAASVGLVLVAAAVALWWRAQRSRKVETADELDDALEGADQPVEPQDPVDEEQLNDAVILDPEMLAAEEEQRARELEELREYAEALRSEVVEARRAGRRGLRELEERAREAEEELRLALPPASPSQLPPPPPREASGGTAPMLCCSRAARLASEQATSGGSQPARERGAALPLVTDLATLGELGPRCLAKRCGRGGTAAAYHELDTLGCARSVLGCARSSPAPGEQADEHGAAWADDAATHVY